MFNQGETYIRQEIHDKYGGQRQGGISTPAKHKAIFIFTSDKGDEFGYQDRWISDDFFLYYGEGQMGNMEFKRGNKAIRDSTKNNKRIYLFENLGKGQARFISEMIYIDHKYENAQDVNGNMRKAIVFQLKSVSD